VMIRNTILKSFTCFSQTT